MNIRTAGTFIAVTLAAMPLIGCGSDRAALSTAPTQSAAPQPAATGLHVTTADSGSGHPQISGEARVSSLVAGTSCPALSFMIGASRVSVTAATTYRGGTCADIAPGTKVKLEGMKDNNNITATSVEIEDRENNDDDNDAEHHEAEGEGVITGLATGTSCPALEFLIGSHRIATRASTVFEGGVCADLHVSTRVHVKGTQGANGTVTATLVRIQSESPGHPEVEGEARVSSLVAGTACPTLKFKIEEWTVTLGTSTVFTGGMCADIAVGKRLGVKGTVTGSHQVLATRITFKGNGDN